jgi:hypothetical protein
MHVVRNLCRIPSHVTVVRLKAFQRLQEVYRCTSTQQNRQMFCMMVFGGLSQQPLRLPVALQIWCTLSAKPSPKPSPAPKLEDQANFFVSNIGGVKVNINFAGGLFHVARNCMCWRYDPNGGFSAQTSHPPTLRAIPLFVILRAGGGQHFISRPEWGGNNLNLHPQGQYNILIICPEGSNKNCCPPTPEDKILKSPW